LETKTPCKVSLYFSTNGGVKWQGPLTKVTGDVGNKIVSGSHNITWNVLEEFDELKGNNIKFQVKAVGSNIETIKIGAQEWTTKNLNVSRYRNGDIIPEVKDQIIWENLTTGAWCYYNNDSKKGAIYGKLYNWFAVNDPRGLAPEGFHIPSNSEWYELIDFLGGEYVAGGKMKERGISHWEYPNKVDFESCGFNGLPGGYRNNDGEFGNIGDVTNWWSSSESYKTSAFARHLHKSFLSASWNVDGINKRFGLSVRCIKD
jgi:uncharacterized protein (TIGR02145 family)